MSCDIKFVSQSMCISPDSAQFIQLSTQNFFRSSEVKTIRIKHYMLLFIILIIILFNDTVSTTEVAKISRKCKQWEGRSRGLFQSTVPAFACRKWGIIRKPRLVLFTRSHTHSSRDWNWASSRLLLTEIENSHFY